MAHISCLLSRWFLIGKIFMNSETIGICSMPVQYSGGCAVHWGDNISILGRGDNKSTLEVVQWNRKRTMSVKCKASMFCNVFKFATHPQALYRSKTVTWVWGYLVEQCKQFDDCFLMSNYIISDRNAFQGAMVVPE